MAASKRWEGFSEDDISKLKSCSDADDVVFPDSYDVKMTHVSGTSVNRDEALTDAERGKLSLTSQEGTGDTRADEDRILHAHCLNVPQLEEPSSSLLSNSDDSIESRTSSQGHFSKESLRSLTASLLLPDLSHSLPSAVNTKHFGAKQKLMEEKNRLRKVYLSKALEDRKKQTREEQHRLNMIQEELQKLDQRLSCDVSIIRNQIETASIEFMEAQKRYDRAEKEFLDAKLLLYTKLERKELLTHHLCTIIEQNEMRKAQKLSELMEKLNLPDNTKEDSLSTQSIPSSSKSEAGRKISSELILTPTSVANCETLSKETSMAASSH